MKLSYAALIFATKAHASVNQVRKYTGDPYIVHPISVTSILEECGVEGDLSKAVAYLHDVLEDVAPKNPDFNRDAIEREFGKLVASLVSELTDVYTKEDFPQFNRAKRKAMEAQRLSTISGTSMEVKMADMLDNTESISKHDPNFFKVYLEEKRNLLRAMQLGEAWKYTNRELRERCLKSAGLDMGL